MTQGFQKAMRAALKGRVGNFVFLDTVDSTHQLACRLINQVDEDDVPLQQAAIVAGRQTGGCGRHSRRWQSPIGGLYMNWVSGDLDPSVVPTLPMLAATAAHRSITSVGVTAGKIKWPNDLLVNGRKIAGLIVHARHSERTLVTVGLGVNIEIIPELDADAIVEATSILEVLGEGNFNELAAHIAGAFLAGLAESINHPESAIRHWSNHLVHEIGDTINVRLSRGETIEGSFAGVTEQGFLRIEGPGGEQTLTGGDVVEG